MADPGLMREILVCYDIEDDRTRTKLFKGLKAIGLRSVQKSVFWGFVTEAERRAVWREVRTHVTNSWDRALVIPVKLSQAREFSLGYPETTFLPLSNHEVI